MKKFLLVVIVGCMFSSVSMAKAHGPAGCGLGVILFEGKEGMMFNILAATFNSSSGNQTFGMSTGTLGCEDATDTAVSEVGFIEANRFALANDIARGQGETLEAYLILTSKEKTDKIKLQRNYDQIFADNSSATDIHSILQKLL